MALPERVLAAVSTLSAALTEAETSDNADDLAALVAACRIVEARALSALAFRVSAGELLAAEQLAIQSLGW